MNILYITNHLNTGGITSYCLTLATGMKHKGHNVYLASSTGDLVEQFSEQGLVFFKIPIKTKCEASPKILLSFLKLRKFIRQNQIDILHAHSRTTMVLAAWLSYVSGIPYLATAHGFFKAHFWRRAFPCWGLRTIAISDPVGEHLVRDFKIEASKVKVIYNGIDINKFGSGFGVGSSELKRKFGLGDAVVIGIIARLADVKGHIYIIGAMPEILKVIPDAQLLIVGEGKMKPELLELSRRLSLEKSIFFVPSVLDTREALAAMDIFVMPSLKEGLGLSLMEAMACGLPVIGSAVGGIKTLITHQQNGLLVQPQDVKGLAQAVLELLQDEYKAKTLGAKAKVFIAEHFSQEKMVSQTEALYEEVLAG